MQGRKTSKKKEAQIIIAKLSNLDKSVRDIAEEVGVSKSTVADTINNSSEIINSLDNLDKARDLLDINISILNEGKKIIEQEIKKIGKEGGVSINSMADIKTLSSTLEDAFKQNQLIKQKPTEIIEINGSEILKDIQTGKLNKENAYDLIRQIKE